MKVIRDYVETMFINIPQTKETGEMKQDILANMEEKYQELIAEGKAENEAIGIVISEFGSIDELLEAVDLTSTKSDKLITKDKKIDLPILNETVIINYLSCRKSLGMLVGIGVILCVVAVDAVLFSVMASFNLLSIIIGVLALAVAVGLFIIAGMKLSQFEYLSKGFILKEEDRQKLTQMKQDYTRSFTLSMVLGVALCLFSLIPIFMLIGDFGLGTSFAVIMMLSIASIGTFFFIYSGNVEASYTFLLQNGLFEEMSQEELEAYQFWMKFEGLYWLAIFALFFILGFVFHLWAIAWIVFPIGGILSTLWDKKLSK